jgi:Ca2+-binding EF-hand superfamily protein
MKKIALLTLLCTASALAAADQKQDFIDRTFLAMDANGDGRVDKSEYTRFQQARFSEQARSIDEAFKELDKDKGGRVSRSEAAVVSDIAKYFDGLDTDQNGFLSLAEMQQAMVAAQTAEAKP